MTTPVAAVSGMPEADTGN